MSKSSRLYGRCKDCGHVWVIAYLPMDVTKVAVLGQRAACAKCACTKVFLAGEPGLPEWHSPETPEQIEQIVALLRGELSDRSDDLSLIARALVWEMEYSLRHERQGWPDGYPVAGSRITPPEAATFSSSIAQVQALLKASRELEQFKESSNAVS